MTTCSCDVGLGNTGIGCTPIQAVSKQLIFVSYYDSTGAVNQIDLTDDLDEAYFTALINNADTTLRWRPLPAMKNIVDERGDDIFEEFEDGSKVFVQDGSRSFTGLIIGTDATPQLLEQLQNMRCVNVGVYIIDKSGNLIGEELERGFLAPIRVDNNSFSAKLAKTGDKTVQKIAVMFNFHTDAEDSRLRMITADELDFAVSGLRGLQDVYSEYSNIDNTIFTVDLYTKAGTPLNPIRIEGMVIGDFALHNVTDDLPIVITDVQETATPGIYNFTFPAQTNGDELRLTPTKTGYDFTNVVTNLIQMPLT